MLVPQVTESKVSPELTIHEASNDLAVVSTARAGLPGTHPYVHNPDTGVGPREEKIVATQGREW